MTKKGENIFMEKVMKISKRSIQVLFLFQILLGIVFIIKNINYVPQYGDTSEYLRLAQTMELDLYRPFVYPFVLSISIGIAEFFKINITYVIYFLQGIVNLLACVVLVDTIKEILKCKLSKKHIIFYALVIFCIPFNLHFNMSILSDSFATSFTILFLCSLIKYTKHKKYRYAIYSAICMFITSNIRSERIYFLSFVLLGVITIEIGKTWIKKKQLKKKTLLILLFILVFGIATTSIAKSIFQKESSSSRTQPSMALYLYERIVGDTLPKLYEYLPEDVKQTISYEEAEKTTENTNYCKQPYEKLYEEDGNLSRISSIFKVAIRRNLPNILKNIMSDFLKNIFVPYYLMIEVAADTQEWTLTRMEGEHYLFTDFYVLWFKVIFLLINIYLLIEAKVNGKRQLKKQIEIKEFAIMILYLFINAVFFSMLMSQNFHIRYIMPVYVIEVAIIILFMSKKGEKLKNERGTDHKNRTSLQKL